MPHNETSRSSMHSIVDRGANDGVKESDVRVIENYPARKVDTRVTWNHEINVTPGDYRMSIINDLRRSYVDHASTCMP